MIFFHHNYVKEYFSRGTISSNILTILTEADTFYIITLIILQIELIHSFIKPKCGIENHRRLKNLS